VSYEGGTHHRFHRLHPPQKKRDELVASTIYPDDGRLDGCINIYVVPG